MAYSAIIYLTHQCPLQCKHCFLVTKGKVPSEEKISFDKAVQILDYLQKEKYFMVAYTGGDPLCHPNLFEILKMTYERGMLPLLGVSGVNITHQIAEKIYDSGVRCVQVSLDGSNESMNSSFRGAGVFAEVINGIDILQQHGINVNVAMCIADVNLSDYKNIINLCYDKHIYKLKVTFYYDYGNDNNFCYEITKAQKAEVIEYCKKFEIEHSLNDWILCVDERNELMDIHKSALVIDVDGSVKNTEYTADFQNMDFLLEAKE